MFIYIILAATAITLIVGLVLLVKRIAKHRLRMRMLAPIEEWCIQVEEATNDDELAEIDPNTFAFPYEDYKYVYWSDFEETERMRDARLKWAAAHRRVRVVQLRANVNAATHSADKAELLVNESDQSIVAEVMGLHSEVTSGVIVRMVLKELALAEAGDAAALKRFMHFSDKYRSKFAAELADSLSFPPMWNDLVAHLIKTPQLLHFRGVDKNPKNGKVGLLAAESLRTQSLVLGKLVLAFCSHERGGSGKRPFFPHREEIGGVLLADVTKMVDSLHAAKQLFVKA